MKTIDAELVRKLLDYDPETGGFRWRSRADATKAWNTRYAGTKAGTLHSAGYVIIKMPKPFGFWRAHRLAWLVTHGVAPAELDHINGDRSDNRIANLREVTAGQNAINKARHKNNTSGHIGVDFNKAKGKWRARLNFNGVSHSAGHHLTAEAAAKARDDLAAKLQGEFRPADPERPHYLHWRNRAHRQV